MAVVAKDRAGQSQAGALPRLERAMDRLVSVVSPGTALKRMQQRAALDVLNRTSYRGASRGRGVDHWHPRGGSANSDLLREHATLRARSRDLVRNHPIASGAIESICANEVRSGMRPRSNIDHELAGIGEEAAEKLEAVLNRGYRLWSPHADVGGRFSFGRSQDLLKRSQLTNGDVLVVRRAKRRRQSPFVLALDLVESDRLSTPRALQRGESVRDKEILNGVELDADGAAVAYWIQKEHPGDTGVMGRRRNKTGEWSRVPAYDSRGHWLVRHLYYVKRPGQVRGEPFFAPVIDLFQQLDDYMDAELVAARVGACFSAFVTKNTDAFLNADANADAELDADDQTVEALAPGLVEYLQPGEEVTFGNPTRPGSAFDTFINAALHFIGAGLGYPPQVLTNNFENMNFSQMRGAIVQAGYMFTSGQDFTIEGYCQPVWDELVREMVDQGDVVLPGYERTPDAYTRARWSRPGREAIDSLKEAQGDAVGLQNKTTSMSDVLSRKGKTFEEHVAELKSEGKTLEAAGVQAGEGTKRASQVTKDAQKNADAPPAAAVVDAAIGGKRNGHAHATNR